MASARRSRRVAAGRRTAGWIGVDLVVLRPTRRARRQRAVVPRPRDASHVTRPPWCSRGRSCGNRLNCWNIHAEPFAHRAELTFRIDHLSCAAAAGAHLADAPAVHRDAAGRRHFHEVEAAQQALARAASTDDGDGLPGSTAGRCRSTAAEILHTRTRRMGSDMVGSPRAGLFRRGEVPFEPGTTGSCRDRSRRNRPAPRSRGSERPVMVELSSRPPIHQLVHRQIEAR